MSAVIIHPGNNFSNILFKLTLILLTSLYLFIYALTQFQLNTASKRAGRHAVWPSVIILGHIEATRATSRQKSSPISRMAMVCFLHIFICPFLCFLHSSLGKSQSLCNMFPPDDLSSGPYTQSIIRFFFLVYQAAVSIFYTSNLYWWGKGWPVDGLPFPDTGCPVPDVSIYYMSNINELPDGILFHWFCRCTPPWMFLPLDIPSEYRPEHVTFVSYLNSHLGYSAGEFQALKLIVLAVFGAVD